MRLSVKPFTCGRYGTTTKYLYPSIADWCSNNLDVNYDPPSDLISESTPKIPTHWIRAPIKSFDVVLLARYSPKDDYDNRESIFMLWECTQSIDWSWSQRLQIIQMMLNLVSPHWNCLQLDFLADNTFLDPIWNIISHISPLIPRLTWPSKCCWFRNVQQLNYDTLEISRIFRLKLYTPEANQVVLVCSNKNHLWDSIFLAQ